MITAGRTASQTRFGRWIGRAFIGGARDGRGRRASAAQFPGDNKRVVSLMNPPGKYTSFDEAPDSSHSQVVGMVPPGARVLEFGCATGYMSEVLKAQLG